MVLDALSAVSLFGRPLQPVDGVDAVNGGGRAGRAQGVNQSTGANGGFSLAQFAIPLESGHDGENQFVNKRVGYCNTLGIG